jgi:site-specific DNA-methyltransferase (adenine-specific)
MLGDNIESLKKLPDNSIDSIVSDPPYGLSFMNKKWDYDVPSVDFWSEVYRVLKPGGHVLSFGGTRTYHRMVVNIEDAGFEIRDQIMWLYGSGFPKSLNIGKAVDKLQGNDREVVGVKEQTGAKFKEWSSDESETRWHNQGFNKVDGREFDITKGQSPYEGWGTALKPANEPICVARKPLSEKSVAENVLKWGTGGINIDGCRVGTTDMLRKLDGTFTFNSGNGADMKGKTNAFVEPGEGRFPANIILECICDEVIKGEKGEVKKTNRDGFLNSNNVFEIKNDGKTKRIENYGDKGDIHTNPMCPCYLLDEQSGVSKSSKGLMKSAQSGNDEGRYNWNNGDKNDFESVRGHNDKGGASRFFYQAKVSKAERNMGLDGFDEQDITDGSTRTNEETGRAFGANRKNKTNTHPTVKPVALMAYLCRLITPPNGIVLDPFMGSGSTGIAAQLEGFRFCGMEMDKDYFKIAEARIENFESYRKFIKK